MEEKGGDAERVESLITTEAKFKEFAADRCIEKLEELVEAFAFETMATSRAACFPMTEEAICGMLDSGGKGKPGFATISDKAGAVCVVVLTSDKMSAGDYPAAATIVASHVVTQFVFSDPTIAGIALNPWNDGGAWIPKEFFLQKMQEIGQRYFQ